MKKYHIKLLVVEVVVWTVVTWGVVALVVPLNINVNLFNKNHQVTRNCNCKHKLVVGLVA